MLRLSFFAYIHDTKKQEQDSTKVYFSFCQIPGTDKPGTSSCRFTRTYRKACRMVALVGALSLPLLFSPAHANAAATGSSAASASPAAVGIELNGSYVGDSEFDVSKVMGGTLTTSRNGYTLAGRVHLQKRSLDNLGSELDFVSVSADGSVEIRVMNVRVMPYLSTGISYGRIDLETLGHDDDDFSTTLLQLGAGFGIPCTPGVTFEARYRYFSPVEREVKVSGKPVDLDIGKHNLLVGLRFEF